MNILAILVVAICGIATVQSDFASECLYAHNVARMQHSNTNNLTYSTSLAAGAAAWASHLIANESGNLVHSTGSYGENLYYAALTLSGTVYTPSDAVYAWYHESEDPGWDYSNPSQSLADAAAVGKAVGHFTQVVWKDTTEVGCGRDTYSYTQDIEGNTWTFYKTIIVARYTSAGNVATKYGDNVKPKTGTGPDSWRDLEESGGCIDKSTSCASGYCGYSFVAPVCYETCNDC